MARDDGGMPALPVSRRQAIVVALVLAVAVLLAARWIGRAAERTPAGASKPVAVRTAATARPKLVVDVSGAVRHPGLYRFRDGARAADAIRRAGGPARKADLEAINLAAPLVDGQQLLVPRRGGPGAPPAGVPGATIGPVSLSSATVDQLDALPGIGPVTAQKIVDWRSAHGGFGSVDDLDAVPGIGPARIEQLRELVTP
jgi:competence protein ComEA